MILGGPLLRASLGVMSGPSLGAVPGLCLGALLGSSWLFCRDFGDSVEIL